ncbi:hypothetical protein [Micromonospora sp. NBC_00858]|uniref:hypothetical protein n=1 Tax=Micromonospora sp. NBC_00858 TaxID=2975979 RepID=UPI0038640C12|nr:hypothetical protein OG990_15775 [Micromonospora sp. NBC_00858]
MRKRFSRSVVTALFGLLIAVPATVLTVASPAFAEGEGCCQVSIDNLPAQFPGGGDPTPFTVHLVNQSQEILRYVDVSFLLQADGLVGDLVDLQRRRMPGGLHDVGTFTQRGVHSGAVTATEQIDFGVLAVPPGGGLNITYQLSFSKKLPSTALTLSMQVQPRRDRRGVRSAGPYESSIVAAGQPTQTQPASTPTSSPTVSDSLASTDGTAPIEQSPLAGAGSSGGDGSLIWLAYTIGALLSLGGIGVIGTLVWRRGPQRVETDWDEPQQYGEPAYPHAPTQVAGDEVPRQAGSPGVYGTPGLHTAPTAQYPTAQYPIAQDPYADPDQAWVDPAAGR